MASLTVFTGTPLHFQSVIQPDHPHVLVLGFGSPVKLKTVNGVDIRLTLSMGFKVVAVSDELGQWKVHTISYNYQISNGNSEILSYHWHPDAHPQIWFPHLHMKGKHSKTHLPTGRVSIEEVIRLLIAEFGVKAKGDWEHILLKAQRTFEKDRTWSSVPLLKHSRVGDRRSLSYARNQTGILRRTTMSDAATTTKDPTEVTP